MAVRSIKKITKHQVTAAPVPLEKPLSPTEAAEAIGVSIHTLRQWLSQRRIAYYKVGRLTRLKREDVEAFIDAGRRDAVTWD